MKVEGFDTAFSRFKSQTSIWHSLYAFHLNHWRKDRHLEGFYGVILERKKKVATRGIFWRFGITAPVIVEGQVCLHIDYDLALRTERSVAHVFNAHIEFKQCQ